YGVIHYQEQVMQIAQVLAGYTLGGADLLRRAMGKKKPEEMAKQRSVFVEGAVARGVERERAAHIFDLMEKFAGYGFNKSHSAAYALLSYQTAYLKAHHPAAFMAAVLSADMDHTDKVVGLIEECKQLALEVGPPEVNTSAYEFTVAGERTILYGLGAIKGVGLGAVQGLIAERDARGAFRSLTDLCRRMDLTKLNRRVLEALIRSGSLDGLGLNRATLMNGLTAAMQLGEQSSKAVETGQDDLFGLAASEQSRAAAGEVERSHPDGDWIAPVADWSEPLRLAGERETLGLYLTGHPIDGFEADLQRFVSARIADLVSEKPPTPEAGRGFSPGRPAIIAGLIDEVRKRGPRMSLVLDDRSGRIEVTLFEEIYQQHRDLIAKDVLVRVEGKLRFDEFSDSWRLQAQRITDLHAARERDARRLILRWPAEGEPGALIARFATLLEPWRNGPCAVTIEYRAAGAGCALTLGAQWNVRAARELIEHLEGFAGRGGVRLLYAAPTTAPSFGTG
ncbi:MAG: OB-fold nucleic acid binding domain-containing protein, partial [Steroidobacteraceae bacterium]